MTTNRKRAPYGAVKQALFDADGSGLTVNEVAAKSGLHAYSIRSAAKAYGIRLKTERRAHGSVKALVQAAYEEGLTVPQLSEASGVPPHTLYSTCRRLGITLSLPRQGSRHP